MIKNAKVLECKVHTTCQGKYHTVKERREDYLRPIYRDVTIAYAAYKMASLGKNCTPSDEMTAEAMRTSIQQVNDAVQATINHKIHDRKEYIYTLCLDFYCNHYKEKYKDLPELYNKHLLSRCIQKCHHSGLDKIPPEYLTKIFCREDKKIYKHIHKSIKITAKKRKTDKIFLSAFVLTLGISIGILIPDYGIPNILAITSLVITATGSIYNLITNN